ncbi:PhoPQ-activated pathogenicity-related family protein [Endozoicomonas sp. YOMI1]|uniref:PhoPQ-activated pathogenicity-related family protein n=1 Tax=Endozoicomonas sp. YOMI1 TaxID=2828739 RepID=UPI002147F9CC|nr:PhoPQ-activated pathogenicity-related family protein [Endozoicomonas sp. YOMI1]
MEHVLPCYLSKEEPDYGWTITQTASTTVKHDDLSTEVDIIHANLVSLRWQQGEKASVDFPLWQHRLTIYKPQQLQYDTALLYINGGIIHAPGELQPINTGPELDFARIAARTTSIVIDLKDIPNQFLQFKDTPPLKEDNLIVFTWKQFLNNPLQNFNWPLRLPMVKAAIYGMNASEEILHQQKIAINGFVIAGASKRGWTASLTATQDSRIVALIPLVADFMNMRAMADHVFNVYPQGNPAISPYFPFKALLERPELDQLIAIVDPYQYKRYLKLPKFFVSASGDHFIPPDTSKVFFDHLPGDKWMRVLPNQGHYINQGNAHLVTDLTESFYGAFLQGRPLPKVTWEQKGKSLNIKTTKRPKEAWLWQANNPSERDFRKVPSNTNLSPYTRTKVKFACHGSKCSSKVEMPQDNKGWTASFVEVHFSNAPFTDLIFTTRVFVNPDRYP